MVIINKKLDSANKNYRKEKSNNYTIINYQKPNYTRKDIQCKQHKREIDKNVFRTLSTSKELSVKAAKRLKP